ncbi:MAG: PQQ-binding-like beta-propeller repeat protein [Candidatus Bathyarchaeia archaeon]
MPLIQLTVAQQNNPVYNGDAGYTDLVKAKNEIRFSVNNASTIYSSQQEFSVKFSASQNTPDDMTSIGAFLYNVSYSASWLNEAVTVYQWSINNPADLDDDDLNPQNSFETTIQLAGVPEGEHHINVTSCGGGYLLISQEDRTVFETFAKKSTVTLVFIISEATPATPTPTINNEEILWKTNIPWNLTGTPAQNYWETEIYSKSRTWTTPVVIEGIAYAAVKSTVTLNTYGNPQVSWINVYAFNTVNGVKIWSYQGNYTINIVTELAVSEGSIYFGAGDYFTALNASNGNLLWRTVCTTGQSNPEVAQGKIFVGSGNSLIALDTIEGSILWNFTTEDVVAASPAVSNGVVYVGSNDANLYALNTEDGQKIWNFKAVEGFKGKPAIDHGTIYAGSSDGYMYALRTTDGSKIWSYDTSPPKVTAPTSTDQTFDPSSPITVDGLLYFTSSGIPYDFSLNNYGNTYGTVYAFSTSSGQMLWSTNVDGKCSLPVIVDNLVYVHVLTESLNAFKANDGKNVWNFSNAETAPAIVNGIAYFAWDEQICAVKTPKGDFGSLPLNLEYSVNYTMFAIMSGLVIACTILIVYSFKKPINLKIITQKIKLPIKRNIFKKTEDTQDQ